MGRLVKLVVIAGLLYFAWTEGWPWLQKELGRVGTTGPGLSAAGDGGSGGDELRCVELASTASDAMGDLVSRFARSTDRAQWVTGAGRVQERIRTAQSACSCAHEACDLAAQAMSALDSNLYELDSLVQGSAESIGNPARGKEEADDLLNEARRALRQS